MNEEQTNREIMDTWISFRVKPSEADAITQLAATGGITRSGLIRATLATGGFVYLGEDVIDALISNRKTLASIGNLLKWTVTQLQSLTDSPLVSVEMQETVTRLLGVLDGAAVDLKNARKDLVSTLDLLHDKVEDLNHGNL